MKLKNRKNIILVLIASIVISTIIWIFNTNKKQSVVLNNDCSATFSMRDNSARFVANLNIYLSMRKDQTGYLDMTGTVNNKGVEYKAARSYSFVYRLQNGNTLHLTNLALNTRAADTADDGVMEKLIFSIDPSTGRYVKITVLSNSWTIGNLYSPLFVCVINE